MASFLHSARRAIVFSPSPCSSHLKTLIRPLSRPPPHPPSPFLQNPSTPRSYIAEMRRSAFQENLLRILRTEIDYETELRPPKQPVTKFKAFAVEERPGEQWIRLRRKYGEKEDVKVEVTMFDGVGPTATAAKTDEAGDNVKLHISMIVDVTKDGYSDRVLQFICSAWPDSLDIHNACVLRHNPAPLSPYMGPKFKDMDEEVQDALQGYLLERGLDNELAAFLHEYMMNKDRTEFVRWMGNVKSYVEK